MRTSVCMRILWLRDFWNIKFNATQNFQRAEVNLYWSHQLKFYVYHRWWCDATSPYDVNVNINHKNDFTSKTEAISIHHIIWSTDIHVGIGTRDRIVQFGKSFMTRLCWRCCCYYWASANTFNHYHYKSTSCLFGNYINFHRVFHSISFAFWCFQGKRILTDASQIDPESNDFIRTLTKWTKIQPCFVEIQSEIYRGSL